MSFSLLNWSLLLRWDPKKVELLMSEFQDLHIAVHFINEFIFSLRRILSTISSGM